MKLKSLLTILILTLFSCGHLGRGPAQVILQENLTDEDKIRILISIHREIPELFSDAARYDIDIFRMLEDQNELQRMLMRHPNFVSEWEKKKLLEMKIEIKAGNDNAIAVKQFKDSAVKEWKDDLLLLANRLIRNQVSLEDEIRKQISFTQTNPTAAGFVNGLIVNLGSDDQPQARALQKAGNWQALNQYLSLKLPEVLTNFKTKPAEKDLSKSTLIKKWNQLLVMEKELGLMTDIFVMGLDLKDVSRGVDVLDAQDLEIVADPDYQKNAFSKLFGQNANEVSIPPYYGRYLATYNSKKEIVRYDTTSGAGIKIVEQNPNVAIFRGCTGGDCSSQYSFPYPNDPNERVFFMYDKSGKLKGYISATMMLDEVGEESLYVITVSGNRVNAVDTEILFQALHQKRSALGVKKIYLPVQDSLAQLVNFSPIRGIYENAILNGKKSKMTYKDQEIRKEIEEFSSEYNSADYDHMAKNREAVLYTPKAKDVLELDVSTKEFLDKGIFNNRHKEVDPLGLMELKIALKKSNREDMLKKIASISLSDPKSEEVMNSLLSIIWEKKVMKTGDIDQALDRFIAHFNLPENTRKYVRDHFLFNAYLAAIDAKEGVHYQENIKRLLADFKFNAIAPLIDRDASLYSAWAPELRKQAKYHELKKSYLEKITAATNIEGIEEDFIRYSMVLHSEKEKIPTKILVRLANANPEDQIFIEEFLKRVHETNGAMMLANLDYTVFAKDNVAHLKNLVEASLKKTDMMVRYNMVVYCTQAILKNFRVELKTQINLIVDELIRTESGVSILGDYLFALLMFKKQSDFSVWKDLHHKLVMAGIKFDDRTILRLAISNNRDIVLESDLVEAIILHGEKKRDIDLLESIVDSKKMITVSPEKFLRTAIVVRSEHLITKLQERYPEFRTEEVAQIREMTKIGEWNKALDVIGAPKGKANNCVDLANRIIL